MQEKTKSAIIKGRKGRKAGSICLADVLKVSDRKKKCGFEVPSRSQRARPVNLRLCEIPSHNND